MPQIKLIQKKIKNRENLKTIQKARDIILKKPLNQSYIICDETQNEKNNKNKTKNNNTYKSKEKDRIKEKQKEKRKSFNSLNDSIEIDVNSQIDEEDSYFESIDRELGDLVGEKIYTIYNKNNIVRQPHLNMNNYYYMSKIRMYNEKIEIKNSPRCSLTARTARRC